MGWSVDAFMGVTDPLDLRNEEHITKLKNMFSGIKNGTLSTKELSSMVRDHIFDDAFSDSVDDKPILSLFLLILNWAFIGGFAKEKVEQSPSKKPKLVNYTSKSSPLPHTKLAWLHEFVTEKELDLSNFNFHGELLQYFNAFRGHGFYAINSHSLCDGPLDSRIMLIHSNNLVPEVRDVISKCMNDQHTAFIEENGVKVRLKTSKVVGGMTTVYFDPNSSHQVFLHDIINGKAESMGKYCWSSRCEHIFNAHSLLGDDDEASTWFWDNICFPDNNHESSQLLHFEGLILGQLVVLHT